MKSGVYIITAPSGGQYVGSAVDISARWRRHRYELRRGIHYNRGIQRASRKYGAENLIFSVLLICRPVDLVMFEQRAIDVLHPRYNACPIAGSQLGRRQSAESNAKNAASHRGRRLTIEHKKNISLALQGNQNTKGREMPEAHRENIALALAGRGPPPEHLERLRHLNTGRKKPAEEIARRQATRALAKLVRNQQAALSPS